MEAVSGEVVCRIVLDVLRPDAFRESVRGLFVVDESQLKDPGALMKLIRDPALR